jgi:hypothetical protein
MSESTQHIDLEQQIDQQWQADNRARAAKQAVADTRAALTSAEARHAVATKAKDVNDLVAVRKNLCKAREKYYKLASEIKELRQEKATRQAAFLEVHNAVRAHFRVKPPAADYLSPDEDPEVAQWTTDHAALEAKAARLMKFRDEINPEANTIECAAYEGLTGTLATLEQSEANILAKLRGRGPSTGALAHGEITTVTGR